MNVSTPPVPSSTNLDKEQELKLSNRTIFYYLGLLLICLLQIIYVCWVILSWWPPLVTVYRSTIITDKANITLSNGSSSLHESTTTLAITLLNQHIEIIKPIWWIILPLAISGIVFFLRYLWLRQTNAFKFHSKEDINMLTAAITIRNPSNQLHQIADEWQSRQQQRLANIPYGLERISRIQVANVTTLALSPDGTILACGHCHMLQYIRRGTNQLIKTTYQWSKCYSVVTRWATVSFWQ